MFNSQLQVAYVTYKYYKFLKCAFVLLLGLDMSGFKLRKEDVVVVLASSLHDEFLTCTATGITAKFARVRWRYSLDSYVLVVCDVLLLRYEQLYFPYLSGSGLADASAINASIKLGLKLVRVPKGVLKALRGSQNGNNSNGSPKDSDTPGLGFKLPTETSIVDEEKFYNMYPALRVTVESIRSSGNASQAGGENGGGGLRRAVSGDQISFKAGPADWGEVRIHF